MTLKHQNKSNKDYFQAVIDRVRRRRAGPELDFEASEFARLAELTALRALASEAAYAARELDRIEKTHRTIKALGKTRCL